MKTPNSGARLYFGIGYRNLVVAIRHSSLLDTKREIHGHFCKRFKHVPSVELTVSQAQGIIRFYHRDDLKTCLFCLKTGNIGALLL